MNKMVRISLALGMALTLTACGNSGSEEECRDVSIKAMRAERLGTEMPTDQEIRDACEGLSEEEVQKILADAVQEEFQNAVGELLDEDLLET